LTEGIIQKVFHEFSAIEYPYSKSNDYINQEAIDVLERKLIAEIENMEYVYFMSQHFVPVEKLIGDTE
jgi:hypothetical protein